MNHPLLLVLLIAAGIHVARLWRNDLRSAGQPGAPVHPLPGATPAPRRAIVVAVAGALLLLALETAGEFALGVSGQQSRMTWLFALYSIAAAPVIEELIFRGWLVVNGRGRLALWASAIAISAVFALVHPFLWRSGDDGFALTLTSKGWFSTALAFATSLWLYFSRFAQWNPRQSLLPCFAAHAAKNAGVVLIKAVSGYMDGIW